MPKWVRETQTLDAAGFMPSHEFSFDTKVLNSSYLEFLDQQIILEARGPEWTKVLKKRRDALMPFIDALILTVFITENDKMATIRIDPIAQTIIDVEEN